MSCDYTKYGIITLSQFHLTVLCLSPPQSKVPAVLPWLWTGTAKSPRRLTIGLSSFSTRPTIVAFANTMSLGLYVTSCTIQIWVMTWQHHSMSTYRISLPILMWNRTVLYNQELAILQPAQLANFHEAVHAVHVDNSDDQWNCQTFVMEVIYQLQQKGLVPTNTYTDCAALM